VEQQSAELAHLEALAAALVRVGLDAQVISERGRPYVMAASPGTGELRERVLCRAAADSSLCFWWPWQQPIGSVDDLQAAAVKIMTVLRPVEGTQ